MNGNTDTKRLTQEQLSEILDLHGKWLRGVPGGVRANLQGAHLENVNLYGANLRNAILQGANLECAILQGANLEDANLRGAMLRGANLRGANLQGANLENVNLYGANLENVNLYGANLRNAILQVASLENVNLQGASLENVDFMGADLEKVDFRGANLKGAKLPSPVLDLSGRTVGYKKVWNKNRTKQVVIELRFPEGSKLVSTVIGRKCRASEAVVVRCVSTGHEEETVFLSIHDQSFIYRIGETARPVEPFDDSVTVECTSGIHFFVTREEAEAYRL